MREYNDAGELILGNNSGDGNPLYNIDKFIRKNQTDKFTMGQSFKIDFTKELFLKINANWMFDEGFYEAFNKDYKTSPTAMNTTRSSSASFDRTLRQTYNAVLNYSKTFAEAHTVSGLIGSEFYDVYSKGSVRQGLVLQPTILWICRTHRRKRICAQSIHTIHAIVFYRFQSCELRL
jgi:hypothetical protein